MDDELSGNNTSLVPGAPGNTDGGGGVLAVRDVLPLAAMEDTPTDLAVAAAALALNSELTYEQLKEEASDGSDKSVPTPEGVVRVAQEDYAVNRRFLTRVR